MGIISRSKILKVLYSHVPQIPNQQGRNDRCGKDKMLKGRRKLIIKTMSTLNIISTKRTRDFFRIENYWIKTKTIPGTIKHQGLIGPYHKDTKLL